MTTYLISYDISVDKLRLKVSKLLERKGLYRVQKSVFVAPHFSPKEIRLLRQEVDDLMKMADLTDSVLCVPLTRSQFVNFWWHSPFPSPSFDEKKSDFL